MEGYAILDLNRSFQKQATQSRVRVCGGSDRLLQTGIGSINRAGVSSPMGSFVGKFSTLNDTKR